LDQGLHRHLTRLERIWISHPIWFITTCTNDRQVVLAATKFKKSWSKNGGAPRTVMAGALEAMSSCQIMFTSFAHLSRLRRVCLVSSVLGRSGLAREWSTSWGSEVPSGSQSFLITFCDLMRAIHSSGNTFSRTLFALDWLYTKTNGNSVAPSVSCSVEAL
jgi:hypothetical protein